MSRLTDEEILVELRDLKRHVEQRLSVLIADVAGRIQEDDACFECIMKEVRESDEVTASFGGCIPPWPANRELPSDGHLPTPAHICCEDDWE